LPWTASWAGGVSICRRKSPSSSAWSCTSAASASCCTGKGSAGCRSARATPRQTPTPRRRIKNFAELVAAAVPESARGKPLELWWQDEARVGQQGSLTYVWAEKGSRPTAPRDRRYAWAYVFGAVCPARGAGAALVLPVANTAAMNLHLQEISTQVAPGAPAVVLGDQAGWHHAGGALKLPDNVSLLHLPSYSPELNPVENIWQFLRQNYLSNRVFDSYGAIVDACCDAWNALIAMPARITSIATRPWAEAVTA
jgi:hypothetical protein